MTDYLVVGHVTRDIVDGQERPGGTVLYAGLLAARWGLNVAAVTSAEPGWLAAAYGQAPELAPGGRAGKGRWAVRAAPRTTIFENIYTAAGRRQRILARAESLGPDDVPAGWRPRILHLGPVAGEVLPAPEWAGLGARFRGCTAQGWLRRFEPGGQVESRWRPELEPVLGLFDAVVLSAEDLGPDLEVVERLASRVRYLALTRAEAGVDLWVGGRHYRVPAFVRPAVDPTGAGDVFAAAFFIGLEAGNDALTAARTAAVAAAIKVGWPGLAGVPAREAVEAGLSATLKSAESPGGRGDDHGRN